LPLAPRFFAILVGLFFLVLILRAVRYAYESLGVSSNAAIFLLLATLIGSFFNIPITELPPERAISHHHVDFFGMRYAVPVVSHWKGTRWLRSMSAVQSFQGGDSHRRVGNSLDGRSRSRPGYRGAGLHARRCDRDRRRDFGLESPGLLLWVRRITR
jgi:hypothetical protein